MAKVLVNPETGVIDNPIHPCYKKPDEGLCELREHAPEEEIRIECVMDPTRCKFYKRAIKKEGINEKG